MIYLLEDDGGIRNFVLYALNNSGFEAKGFETPSEFYSALGGALPELVLLDRMLPEEDGMTVLAIGFIIPNQKCEDSFWSYAVPVDKVEQATGLDFYALLDDRIEDAAEASADTAPWK